MADRVNTAEALPEAVMDWKSVRETFQRMPPDTAKTMLALATDDESALPEGFSRAKAWFNAVDGVAAMMMIGQVLEDIAARTKPPRKKRTVKAKAPVLPQELMPTLESVATGGTAAISGKARKK